jgi:hypothetical protein
VSENEGYGARIVAGAGIVSTGRRVGRKSLVDRCAPALDVASCGRCPDPVAFNAATLRTSLYTSIMAFNVADLVVGIGVLILVLGLAVGGVGVALAGLAIPRFANKVYVEPVAAEPAHPAMG